MPIYEVVRYVEAPDILEAFVRDGQVNSVRLIGPSFGEPLTPATPSHEKATPAQIKASVRADELTCFECGKGFRTLKRHLMTHHQLTPQQYRERWGLPAAYPIVAPAYSARRSELAKEAGLGQK